MDYLEKYDNYIIEEIEGAECYAKMAFDVQEDEPRFANALKEMAKDELAHAESLHEIAEAMIIDDHSRIIYDYLHKKHKEKISSIKAMIMAID